jgi:hypothetical protein
LMDGHLNHVRFVKQCVNVTKNGPDLTKN